MSTVENVNRCPLCGFELVEGKCPNAEIHLKPMCLNCYFGYVNEDGKLVCGNEDNKKKMIEKMVAAMGDSYELDINSVVLKPLPIKDCTKKCKQWVLSDNVIKNHYHL
jgi:hypothetical protein